MPDLWMDVDVALGAVPVNIFPLIDDSDFKTREISVAYNAAGMDLVWNFVSCAGVFTQTAVTPTTAGVYDWTNKGDGMYAIEIPASGGASINNDTEGVGWFSGIATGVLPWRGPTIGFRAAGLNDLLIENAYSTTRGLAGTALPNAAAEAAGGLFTRGTGAGQINQDANGRVDVNVHRWLTGTPNALISGRVDANAQAIADSLLTLAKFSGVFPSNFASLLINASGHVSRVTLADAVTLVNGITSSERILLAAAIEAAILNDGDSNAVLQAIADKFAADFDIEDLTLAAIAAAVRDAILDRATSSHATAGTVGKAIADAATQAAAAASSSATAATQSTNAASSAATAATQATTAATQSTAGAASAATAATQSTAAATSSASADAKLTTDRLNKISNLLATGVYSTFDAAAQAVDLNADQSGVTIGTVNGIASSERILLAAAIEAAILNDGDSNAVLQAIADKFAAEFDIEDLTLAAIAAAVRDAILDRATSSHATAGTVGKAIADAATSSAAAVTKIDATKAVADLVHAKTTNLPASPAAVGSQMDLVNAPNATAVTALQTGLATSTAITAVSNKIGTPNGASLSVDVAAVKSDTGNLLTSLAAKFLGMTNLPNWLRVLFGANTDATALAEINDPDGDFDETSDTPQALAAAIAALEVGGGGSATVENQEQILEELAELATSVAGLALGAGNGLKTVTITVQDQANAATKIENVSVSAVASGLLKGSGRSNVSGQVVLHLDPGTYGVPSGIPGQWQMADPNQTIEVTADGPNEFTILAVALGSPAKNEPGTKEGRIRCRNDDGEYGPGIVVWLRYESGPGEAGESLSTVPFSATSGDDGWAVFPGLLCESQLYGWREDSEALQELVDVPADGGPDAWFLLPEILGRVAEPGCGCT